MSQISGETNKYAVVRSQGHQYVVTEGKPFLVPLAKGVPEFDVLLTVDGDKIEVGTPVLDPKKFSLEVVEQLEKGEKISVFKYKSKSRYRKRIGSRAKFTKVVFKYIKP